MPESSAPDPPTRPRPWLRQALVLCLGIKLLLMALGVAVAEVRLDKPFRDRTAALSLWRQWDSKHYLDIAENGYAAPDQSASLAFPPLLPALVRGAGWITGSTASGGVAVATLLSFLPGLLLYQLARCDLSEDDSFRALMVLLLFPTSFFLHIVYTEALFLSLVLGAFLAARRGHWKWVALLGFLCGLTRLNAFLLAPALMVEAWGTSPRGRVLRTAAALSVGGGIALYLALNYAVASDPLAFLTAQGDMGFRRFAWPWEGGMDAWRRAGAGGARSVETGVFEILATAYAVIGSAVSLSSQRRSYAVWMIGNTLVFTAQGFWLSLPRLALALFPAFIWLAPRTAGPVFGALWFAASTLLLSFFAGQFAQGWWVS